MYQLVTVLTRTYALNPLIPWPFDFIGDIVHTCHSPLRRLVDQVGWGEAIKHPEVRRWIKVTEGLV